MIFRVDWGQKEGLTWLQRGVEREREDEGKWEKGEIRGCRIPPGDVSLRIELSEVGHGCGLIDTLFSHGGNCSAC